MRWRTLLPPAGSTVPQSKIFSDSPRRTAFDWMRSLTAVARNSSSVTRTSSSLPCSRSTVAPRKSYRCTVSRRTWSSALRSSWASNSLTTSNETSPLIRCRLPGPARHVAHTGAAVLSGASMPVRAERGESGTDLEMLEQQLRDPVAPPAAHDEHGVAFGWTFRRATPPSSSTVPGAIAVMPGSSRANAGRERLGRRDRGVQVAARPDVRRPRPHRPRRARRRTRRASPRFGGTSAARRPPRRAGRARAGGAPRAWRGSPSDGGRSRRTPRRRAPRPCARGAARCPGSSRAPTAADRAASGDPGSPRRGRRKREQGVGRVVVAPPWAAAPGASTTPRPSTSSTVPSAFRSTIRPVRRRSSHSSAGSAVGALARRLVPDQRDADDPSRAIG